ncbi:hypothetical protein AMS68_004742 [Peltaster fructicola]|uniref:Uncharacterized protein n=1 Tax=Peltaster fructicola TaxID=286661 RepID=A0A6H0XX34_9PEZI|nr:hypothetical protein AMS68_004742 [Peltaster fructicola]
MDLYSSESDRAAFVKLLKNDLVIYERLSHSAVCSPASDNLIGMHAGSIDTDDEIEAVFASGNTMDESLMQRIFLRIMQRAEKSTTATTHPSAPCRWLSHLRMLDQAAFDNIVSSHLHTLLSNFPQQSLPRGVSMLMAADCYDIARIVDCLKEGAPARSHCAMLTLLAAPPDHDLGVSDAERYHLCRQQRQFRQDNPTKMKAMLIKASPVLNFDHNATWLIDVVAALQGQVSTSEPLPATLGTLYEGILLKLDGHAFSATQLTTELVISHANALNAPLCAAWLSCHPTQAQSAQAALNKSARSGSGVWPLLLGACPAGVVSELHTGALEALLKENTRVPDENNIAIFDVTHSLLKQTVDQSVFTTIANKLKAIAKVVSSGNEDPALFRQVETLLHVVLLCTSASKADVHAQGRAYIVIALCSILSLSSMENNSDLAEYITDIAGTLIDHLSCEVISHMSRSAHNAGLKPSAIASCFGAPPQRDSSWLVLASAVQPSGGQQARALLKPGMAVAGPGTATRNPALPQSTARSLRPGQQNAELKYTPFSVRRWEVMPDPTPVIGENDSSLSLTLFGARKA